MYCFVCRGVGLHFGLGFCCHGCVLSKGLGPGGGGRVLKLSASCALAWIHVPSPQHQIWVYLVCEEGGVAGIYVGLDLS